MIYVALPIEEYRPLPFYLAMEEFVARTMPARDYFFMWQVNPTVIFGRNQLIDSEVNVGYCRERGIEMYRRKSGGGCVYADRSNIMLSYITPESNVNFTFNRYMLMVEHVLRNLGIDARTTGRNDILVDGKKISGNAFYHLPDRSIVHGTMLYDTDIDNMLQATTPSLSKLKSKGVESVRQHITTLNKYLEISIEEFKQYLRNSLCDEEITLSLADVEAIEKIALEYNTPEFIYGNNPAYTTVVRTRIEGVGEFEARIEVKDSVIKKVNLLGDYFVIGDIDSSVLNKLRGVEYTPCAVSAAVVSLDVEGCIHNLKKEQLIKILFN